MLKITFLLQKSNSKEIINFKRIINYIYNKNQNVEECYLCDLESLKELFDIVEQMATENEIDKIKKLHLRWLSQDLEKIILKIKDN